MWQKAKDSYHNLRRHKIMVLLIIILSALCYRMFISNYTFVRPIIKLDEYRAAQDDHNGLVLCSQELDQAKADKQTAIEANNPDLFK